MFNNADPPPEHFERYSKKLSEYNKPRRNIFNRGLFIKIAATVLILLVLSVVVSYLSLNKEGMLIGSRSSAALPEELKEVELYYSSVTQNKIEEITSLADSPEQAEELKNMAMEEVQEIESDNQQLQKAYLQEGKNEKLLNAISNNYKVITNLLDHIINELNRQNNRESMNQIKKANYETIT